MSARDPASHPRLTSTGGPGPALPDANIATVTLFAMRTSSSHPSFTVPAAHAAQLVRLVRHWNVTPEQLLGGHGLTEESLEAPHGQLPIETMNQLVARARTLTGEPGLGFYMGLQTRASAYGILGLGITSAASLREALELAVKFTPVVTAALSLRLRVEGSLASLLIEEHADLGSVRDVALISLLVGFGQIGNALTGRELDGVVELAIPEPPYFYRFAHMAPSIRFDQDVTQVVFDAANLDLPLAAADPAWLRLAREQCESALEKVGRESTFDGQVRRALANGDDYRSLEEVAVELRLSPRTLARRLAEHGYSFSSLVSEERLEKALLLLRSARYTIKDVSERMGYSTTTNFVRAFRRWTGRTPAAYRRSMRNAA
jgi:AraC-like DNA-binding protein